MHKLLTRQLKKATREDGQVDVDRLLELVGSAYDEADKERRLTQHSFGELSQEMLELNDQIKAEADARLDAQTQLVDAIESLDLGFTLFDPSDDLVVCNSKYKEFYFSGVEDEVQPGKTFEEIMRLYSRINRGDPADTTGPTDNWLNDRLTSHRSARMNYEHLVAGERWVLTDLHKTDGGGTVYTHTDITERKLREQEIAEKSVQLGATLENMGQGISMVDANLVLSAFNQQFLDLFQLPESLGRPGTRWSAIVEFLDERGEFGAEGTADSARDFFAFAKRHAPCSHEHARPDGRVIEINRNPMPGGGFVVTYTDETERNRAELVQGGRNDVLERLATGASLEDVLGALVAATEAVEPEMICSVLLLDKKKKHLNHGASQSLPEFFNMAIDGIEIGVDVGSCGAAAFLGRRVIVEDILVRAHPRLVRRNPGYARDVLPDPAPTSTQGSRPDQDRGAARRHRNRTQAGRARTSLGEG